MRTYWALPRESLFLYSEHDWLLLLLDECSPEQRVSGNAVAVEVLVYSKPDHT
jgi:hypothetical protein